ncbi:hypothetical protein ES708_06299 [subsurface metagenome]
MSSPDKLSPSPLNKIFNTVESTTKSGLQHLPLVPYFKFYGNSIVLYDQHAFSCRRKQDNENSLKNLKCRKFTGNMSKATRKYLMRKLTTWVSSITQNNKKLNCSPYHYPHRPVFITLTLPSPQRHSDREFKRVIFDYFLKWLQRETGSNLYFWRAESQKNGNIHFHIIHDTYIDKIKLQTFWNKLLKQHGYNSIDKVKYVTGCAPSTHVMIIDDEEVAPGYILKDALKAPKIRPIEGRIWGMSDKLRAIAPVVNVLDSGLKQELTDALLSRSVTLFQCEYVRMISIENLPKAKNIMKRFYQYKDEHAQTIYDYLYRDIPLLPEPVISEPMPVLISLPVPDPGPSQMSVPGLWGPSSLSRAALSL